MKVLLNASLHYLVQYFFYLLWLTVASGLVFGTTMYILHLKLSLFSGSIPVALLVCVWMLPCAYALCFRYVTSWLLLRWLFVWICTLWSMVYSSAFWCCSVDAGATDCGPAMLWFWWFCSSFSICLVLAFLLLSAGVSQCLYHCYHIFTEDFCNKVRFFLWKILNRLQRRTAFYRLWNLIQFLLAALCCEHVLNFDIHVCNWWHMLGCCRFNHIMRILAICRFFLLIYRFPLEF